MSDWIKRLREMRNDVPLWDEMVDVVEAAESVSAGVWKDDVTDFMRAPLAVLKAEAEKLFYGEAF